MKTYLTTASLIFAAAVALASLNGCDRRPVTADQGSAGSTAAKSGSGVGGAGAGIGGSASSNSSGTGAPSASGGAGAGSPAGK